ncbi:MAG: T9SS type A sorting domain-containing protein [Draconibacterium sp.]|nr:T9SS type A sorting domain-containing protein [Draconibacterium sp.]
MKKQIMIIAFVAIAISAFSQNLIRGEYFIDSDPGFGNATGFTIAVPDSDLTHAITIPYSSFNSSGYHNLFFRTQNSNGNWSQTTRSFVEADDDINMSEIIKVEYFFNADNGFGNNSIILLDASPEKTWEFTIPFDQLPSEWKSNDTLFVRVQDDKNKGWSQTSFIDSLNFVMVGIKNLEQITGVSIYPNPFSDEINVSLKNDEILQLVLYNEKGQLIFDKELKKSDKINTQFLASGIYVIAIYANNKRLYGSKIVKH